MNRQLFVCFNKLGKLQELLILSLNVCGEVIYRQITKQLCHATADITHLWRCVWNNREIVKSPKFAGVQSVQRSEESFQERCYFFVGVVVVVVVVAVAVVAAANAVEFDIDVMERLFKVHSFHIVLT